MNLSEKGLHVIEQKEIKKCAKIKESDLKVRKSTSRFVGHLDLLSNETSKDFGPMYCGEKKIKRGF